MLILESFYLFWRDLCLVFVYSWLVCIYFGEVCIYFVIVCIYSIHNWCLFSIFIVYHGWGLKWLRVEGKVCIYFCGVSVYCYGLCAYFGEFISFVGVCVYSEGVYVYFCSATRKALSSHVYLFFYNLWLVSIYSKLICVYSIQS